MKSFVINKMEFKKTEIKSEEEARQKAIDFQSWASEENLSYGELNEYHNYFRTIAEKFNLTEEFKENGII